MPTRPPPHTWLLPFVIFICGALFHKSITTPKESSGASDKVLPPQHPSNPKPFPHYLWAIPLCGVVYYLILMSEHIRS